MTDHVRYTPSPLRGRLALALATVVCAVFGLGVGAAFAARVHPFSSFNGEPGALLANPWGIDVDGAGGVVLVGDSSNHQVAQFDLIGAPREFSGLGSNELTGAGAPLAFEAPTIGVADVPGGGDLYVTDYPHNVVDVFNPAGEYVSQLTGEGLAAVGGTPQGSFSGPFQVRVDPSSGDVWVLDSGHDVVDEFEPEEGGKKHRYLRQIDASVLEEPLSGLQDVAVGSEGEVFVAGSNGSRFQVDAFSALGEFQFVLDANNATSVAVDTSTTPNTVYALDEQRKIGVYEATSFSGVPLEQFSAPGEHELQDLGVDSSSHTVYATDYGDSQVDVFKPLVVLPTPVTGEASQVLPTSATLNGTASPEGVELQECSFEYGESESYGSTVACEESNAAIGAGNSPVAVRANVSSLHIGTGYHFRLKVANVNGSELGSDASFATPPPPSIHAEATINQTATTADLTAKIDPNGADTAYRFEYGTSTAYGSSAPVPDGDIGAGSSDVPVTQTVSGLLANTTYHWRLVAHSAAGTVTSVDHTFVYGTTGAGLPDGRAYEMVTPPAKNGALIGDVFQSRNPQVAADGGRVIMQTIQCLGGAVSCPAFRENVGTPYAFTRTSGGWVPTPLAPPATQFATNTVFLFNADTGMALFSMPTAPMGEDDFYARQPDGSFVDVGPLYPPSLGALGGPEAALHSSGATATADFSHVVFSDAMGSWPFDKVEPGDQTLLEYVGGGNAAPVLVGVSGGPGSTDLISRCNTTLASRLGALSADGRTVFFRSFPCSSGSGVNTGVEVPANELYARIDQARTVFISGRSPLDCTGTCQTSPPSDAVFEGASADGSKAFFTSTQQLTDSAGEDSVDTAGTGTNACIITVGVNGCNLYEYDFANPAGHSLLAVSACEAAGCEPRVQGVMAVSRDGSHVYFVARGVLTDRANDRGQIAQNGADNLYAFERDGSYPNGRVSFIAMLPEGESAKWSNAEVSYANVTPDGRFLVFTSTALLTADDTRADGARQVFRYDAQSGVLVRVSIGEDGFNDNGNAGVGDAIIPLAAAAFGEAGSWRADPTMSDDGSFVFFQSPVGLTPGALDDVRIDVNGKNLRGEPLPPEYAQNVYEWHAGHVYLISDGRDTGAASLQGSIGVGTMSSVELLGSDASGANVFFSSSDRLVSQDTDTQTDLYDARICTASDPCIALPPAATAACQGEGCRGAPGAPPVFGAPGSAVFSGAGNFAPPQTAPVVKAKRKGKAKKPKAKKPGKKLKRGRKGRKAARTGKHVKRGRR
jgi:DNA-binding beta-propeller fold protein YncE